MYNSWREFYLYRMFAFRAKLIALLQPLEPMEVCDPRSLVQFGWNIRIFERMGILINALECRDWVPCTVVQMKYECVVMRVVLAK